MSTLSATGPVGELIVDDRHCTACGYNLRGLFTGAPCPECGQAISLTRRLTNTIPLYEMPAWYRGTLRAGVHLLEVGALLGVGVLFALIDGTVAFVLAGVAALAWALGVGVFVMPRPIPARAGRSEWVRLRWACGLTQSAPLVGVALAAIGASAGMPILTVLGLVCIGAGAVGLVPVTVYLSFFADWAGNATLGDRLRSTGWMLGATLLFITLGMLANAVGAIGPLFSFSVFGAIAQVLWLLSVGYLVYLVFGLDTSMRWARRNGLAAQARDVRRAERAHEEAQRMVRQAEQVYVPPPPPSGARSLLDELGQGEAGGEGGRRGEPLGGRGRPQPYPPTWTGPGMKPPDDVEPYALEE